jgi:hypothetical protein
MNLARLSRDEKVGGIVSRWDGLSRSDRRYISLEDLCDACAVEPAELVGAIAAGCYEGGLDVRPLVAASFNYLLAVGALIRGGLTPEGDDKRKRLLRRIGFL